MSQEQESARDFFRTRARVVVRYGPVNQDAKFAVAMDARAWESQSGLETQARRVMEEAQAPEDLKPMLSVLRWLDFKLDLILHHLRSREVEAHFKYSALTTDISGSGLALDSVEGLKPGEVLMLFISLPDSPSRGIFALGEVVRAESDEENPSSGAIKFVEISEEDRERIIRFSFSQQRRELARRAESEV